MSKNKNLKARKPQIIEQSQESSQSDLPLVAAEISKKDQKLMKGKQKKKISKQIEEISEKKNISIKKKIKSIAINTEETRMTEKKKNKINQESLKKKLKSKNISEEQNQQSSEEQNLNKINIITNKKVKSPLQKQTSPNLKIQGTKNKILQKTSIQKVGNLKGKKAPIKQSQSEEQENDSQEEQKSTPKSKPFSKTTKVVVKPLSKGISSQQDEDEEDQEEQEQEQEQDQQQEESQKKEKNVQVSSRKKSKDSAKISQQDQVGEFEICVQGLSYNAYDNDIRLLFEECGQIINVKLLMRNDGKCKGTAFVKFSHKSSFNSALQFNGSEHMGRSIRVEQSQGKQDQNNKKSFSGDRKNPQQRNNNYNNKPQGQANIETPTLFLGGISYNSTIDSIQECFEQVGPVASVRIITDKQTGKPRGFGYVQFHDVQTAKKAYKQLNGCEIDGRTVRLDSAAQRSASNNQRGGGNNYQREGNSYHGGNNGGSFQRSGQSRNPGNSTVILNNDDKNAKKGVLGTFQGKKTLL